MKMFQTHVSICEQQKLPPYFPNKNAFKDISLLQTTNYCRDGKQRLPTPDKLAILELSTNFQKRRLGKQQRILTDITRRCREQDITDLSTALSIKCHLKDQGNKLADTESKSSKIVFSKRPYSDPSQSNRLDTGYQSFPVRKIIKSQTFDSHRQPMLSIKSGMLTNGFHTGRSKKISRTIRILSNSPRKRKEVWTSSTQYSTPQDTVIFATMRIAPEPRSKTSKSDFYTVYKQTSEAPDHPTKEQLLLDDSIADVRQQ